MDADEQHDLNPPTGPLPASVRRPAPAHDDPAQLQLLDQPGRPVPGRGVARDWLLDESTRSVGRRGIEQARAALRSARRHHDELDHGSDPDRDRATAA